MNRLIASSFVCLCILGCASSHILTGTARPPISATQVKIYSHPPANFEEVAILTASSENSWAVTEQGKTDAVIKGLKKEAAKLGANGVLIQSIGTNGGGSGVGISTGQAYGSGGYSFGTGTTFFASESHRSGQAAAIYVFEGRSTAPASENSEVVSNSNSI